MDAETKICPYCAETIKAAARKCPHCQTGLIKIKNGAWPTLIGLSILFYGPILLGTWWMKEFNAPGEPFEPHRARIIIQDTSMHYSQSEHTNIITTVGYMRNDSPYPWKSLQLEAQYFDAIGRLIDTKTETLPYQELPAGVTQAFRIRAAAATDQASYASYKVNVRTAKDARKLWTTGD